MAPIVCRYYSEGKCRYGDQCKYAHPRDVPRNDNRFTALQTNDNNSRNNYSGGRSSTSQNPPYSLNRDIIIADLSTERPQWILSAYGPGSKAPEQLMGGPVREQSFEEMRLRHYDGVASGNPALAIQEANALVHEAESQMRKILHDVDGAMNFIRNAENNHPNRNDVCQASTKAPGYVASSSTPIGAGAGLPAQVAPGFGQPSVLGAKPNPFSTQRQAFGQPSLPGSGGTFGQPSVIGQKLNLFGAPSGGAGTAPGPFSSFAATTNPFGTPAQPAVANPFVQTAQAAPFSQDASQSNNPFAQNAAPQNPFGQPTNQPQPRPFTSTASSTPFGAPSPAAQQNPFGSPSQPIRGNSLGTGGNEASPSHPFGQPQPVAASPNLFAQPVSIAAPNPFGQAPAQNDSRPNPLAPSAQAPQTKQNPSASQSPYGPNAQFQHPTLQSYASQDSDQRLRMFKGKPVSYRDKEAGFQNQDGTWEKIWFPDGPPIYYSATELGDNAYSEETRQAYLYLRQRGSFKDGAMPLLPPKREWCLWDF